MIFKTWLTDLTKIQGVVNNIKNVSAIVDSATGLLNPNVVNSLSSSINGLNLQQAQLALSTKNLTQEQMNQVLVQTGLIASEDKIQAELVQSTLTQAQLSAEKQKAILIEAGLINRRTGEILTTKACTKEELLNALATQGVTGANAEAIISALGLTGANEGLSFSFELLTASIKQTMGAMASNPVTWITALIGITYAAVKAYDYFNVTVDEANEALEESKENYDTITSDFQSLQDELKTTSDRIDELNSKESLSLVEDEELEKLKETSKELEYQIALKKEEQRIAAEETLDDAKDVYNTKLTSDYDKHNSHGNSVGNQVTVTEELENAIEEYKKQEEALENARERFFELEEKKNSEGLSKGKRVSSNHGRSTTIVENEEQEYEDLKTDIEEIEEAMTSASNRAYEMSTYIENVRSSLQAVRDGGGMLSSDDLNMLKESTAYMDEYEDFYNYQQGILENFDKMDVTEQREALVDKLKKSGLTAKDAQEIIDNTDDKDLEVIAKISFNKNETKDSVMGAIEEAQKLITDETSILSEAKLEELREQADQLSSIINEIQSSYDTLQSAIEEYNEQGYLSLDTLNSLLSLDDEYLACLVNENGQLSLNADAMNALAQSKLNEAEASAVAEAMTELYAIANGEAASSTANYISGNANLMQSLALLAGQYDNVANAAMTAAQAQKLSAMIEAANAKDSAATARVMSGLNSRLGLIHSTASSIKTRNVGGISNKKSSGSGSASSVDTWKEEFQAQYDLLKHNLEMEYLTEEQYYGALNALNEKYFANNAKYTDEYRKYQEEVYKGLQKVYKEYIENQMSYLEKALAANKISFSHYSSAVKTMLDDMWKDGKISAEDYWSYVEKMLKQQLDIYDSVINAVTNLLDKEIDKIQNEIDALEDKNDALNKQLDQYDGILAIVDDVYDAEIERIREQQDAIDDTIDKLQKENDEKQRGIELEKARYQLYKSLNQRNVKLFNGQEFVYTTNRDEVREAQQNLADLEFDQTIDALEKERDALDAEIEKLEEFKEKWADITEAYDNEINKQLAIALWGKDYESIILSNRISDIENFKDEYTSIQAQIDDNQSMIDSYNEKIEYYEYLKEQWSDISKVYDEERDKLYASQILGAQWEKDILSGRLDLLNNFKEQYVLLQQQMAEAAVNSANAIIEANNRINSSTTSVPSSPFSGGSSGGGGTSTPAPAPVDPHPDKYWVYKTLGTYSTSGEASSKIGMLGGDQVIKVGSKYLVVKWKKGYTTQGEASSHISFLGGNGVYKRYAKGTINARKGLHLVSEDKYGDEIILRNNGTAVVAKGEQFYPFEGGETVINASDTKKLLANMDNLVPLHDTANPFARLKLQPIDSNAMVMNHLNLPNYNNLLPVNRDSSTTISIGDIHLHEVQNANTLANSIIRELPSKVIQRLGK